tara:strand:+ start:720 stop:2144 length:1425 start_codon:yes stop_codon:yes gene_type:complete
MLEKLQNLWEWLMIVFQGLLGLIISNVIAVIGFVLAFLILMRIFREQRRPSSILAWSFFIIMIPYLGVPLYFLLGGRKLKKKIAAKGFLTKPSEGSHESFPVQDVFELDGNQVKFLTDGQIAFQTYCNAICEAKEEIHILTYILSNDRIGNSVLDLLIEKADEGVKVRLVVDALGSFWAPKKKIAILREAGGEFSRFMPAFPFQTHGWANLRIHRKIATFDNRKCILGGRNLDLRFMGDGPDSDRFFDFGAVYEGPIVECLNRIFVSDWAFASKQKLEDINGIMEPTTDPAGHSTVMGIASGPDVEGDILYERLINAIQEFDDEIVIVTPYFVPDEVLLRSLIVKARAKKKVTIILPENSNWKVVDFVRSLYLRELHQAGVEILLFQAGMLHAKVLLADQNFLLHGSANFDIRSLFVNFEIGMIHKSPEDIQAVSKWLSWISENCRPYGTESELNPSRGRRILEDAARLLAPLL